MGEFKKGELIVIAGSKLDSEGLSTHKHTLASIVEIGKYDLFAVCKTSSAYRQSIFRVPKTLCSRVVTPTLGEDTEIRAPKIGDLVMSVSQNFNSEKVEKKSGILKEIIDLSWQFKTAKIMIGNKYENVPYDSLVVLEE